MVEPVNLNKARKARAATAARKKAAENRVAFGRSKGQRKAEQADADKAARELDAKRRLHDDE